MKLHLSLAKLIFFALTVFYGTSSIAGNVNCSDSGSGANCFGDDFSSDVITIRNGVITSTVSNLSRGAYDLELTSGRLFPPSLGGIDSSLTNTGTLDDVSLRTKLGPLKSTINNSGPNAILDSISNQTDAGTLTSTITNNGPASQINGSINNTTVGGTLTSTITNSGPASQINESINNTTVGGTLTSTITNSGPESQINGSINLKTGLGVLNSTINNGSAQVTDSSINGDINFSGLGVINTSINNFGVINGNISAKGTVLKVLDFNFVNHGSLTGNINTIGLVNPSGGATIDNQAGATWSVNGTNNIYSGNDILTNYGKISAAADTSVVLDFGQGTNAVNNAGVINASNGSISFTHTANSGSLLFQNYILIGNLVSAGKISMTDGADGNDRVTIDGDYDSGWKSGILTVDAQLDLGGTSDKLYINGTATGLTHVTVTDLNTGFASAYNPNGMLVVDADGPLVTTDGDTNYRAQQLFTLSSGPIDKGFFNYDLYYSPGDVNDNNHRWYLRNAANARAYELAKIASATQEVWYESAYAWKDRAVGMRSLLTSSAGDQEMPSGPALWIRAFGTDSNRDTHNQVSTAAGSFKTDTSYNQRTSGVVGGIDSKVLEGEESGSLLLGLMAGYTNSRVDFDNTGSDADIDGMNVGAYANYANKGFFADALIKLDRHDINYKTSFIAPDRSKSFDGRTFGALLNVGYRIGSLGGTEGLFFEPTFSLASIQSTFDRMQMLNSNVEISDAGSTRSRIGVRGGNTWMSEGLATELYIDAGANWEFDAKNSAILSNGINSVRVADNRDGNFGDVGLGLNFIDLGSGLSGFAKAQYRFDNEQETSNVQLGIHYKF